MGWFILGMFIGAFVTETVLAACSLSSEISQQEERRVYWHELSREHQQEILKQAAKEYKTVGWFTKNYKQPDWCTYPDAMDPKFGCWSLVGNWEEELGFKSPEKIDRSFCDGCEYYRSEVKHE